MSYLVNLVMEGRTGLVVGAGTIAARKVRDLLAGGAKVSVVAPEVCAEIRALANDGRITLIERSYRAEDLSGIDVVVAATNDEEVNAAVSRDAQARGVLVNVVDRPSLCTFTLPAVVRRGDLTLAVATDGRCPAFSSALREELEGRYGAEYQDALDLFADVRAEMMARGWSSAQILEAVSSLYRSGVIALLACRDYPQIASLLRQRLGEDFPLPPWLQDR